MNSFLRACIFITGVLAIPGVASASRADRTSLQLTQTTDATYPPALLMEGVSSGEVWMLITVDETGTLTDSMVTRTTHAGFRAEALRAVRSLKYKPATVDGKPVPVRSEIHLSFASKGQVISLNASSTVRQLTAFALHGDYVNYLCEAAQLDRSPAVLHSISPLYPASAATGPAVRGNAVLDFIIDESGVARMPVVVKSTSLDFAAAATDALAQWRFSPPVRQGKPVAVRVRQEFIFSPPAESTEAGAPAKRLSSSGNRGDLTVL